MAATKIMIIPHQHPDGDCLGSASALKEYLDTIDKDAVIFCATPAHPKYHFLPQVKSIATDPAHFDDSAIDTIVVFDSGDLRYAGVSDHLREHRATIINIDHHPTNEKYGAINLVVPHASSTAEIVYNFFRHNQITISAKIATALLTGIITDTDNFTNGATSASALLCAGELLRAGGNLGRINRLLQKNKSLSVLRLWGVALSRLAKDEKSDITHTYLTQQDFIALQANDSEADGIANFLNNLDGAKTTLMLRETADGKTKGSLRTTLDDIDVSAIAKRLGGGGHKKAAGFTTDAAITETLKKVLQ